MFKRILACILTAASLLLFAGCGTKNVKEAKDKTFSVEGMNITLTGGFSKKDMEGYTACFDSSEIAVFALRETADGISAMSLLEYAALVLKANASKSPSGIETIDGMTCLEYTWTNETTQTEYKYLTFLYKAPDAFWMVQFSCKTADYEADKPYFVKWAKTVRFDTAES